jgi:hypothetical protein
MVHKRTDYGRKSIFGVFLGKISSEGQAFTFKGVLNTGIFS